MFNKERILSLLDDIIAHEYHRIDEEEIFIVMKRDLPHLMTTVKQMKRDFIIE